MIEYKLAANLRILFVGISSHPGSYRRGIRDCSYGWQENVGSTRVYVMHFPIRGPASIRIRELAELKEAARRS